MRAMKDSGIEWIGEIPKEWTIKRIKYLANKEKYSFVDGDWIDSPNIMSDGIRYLTSGNIGDGSFKEQGDGYISQDTFEKLNCTAAFPNDLVFSRLNSPYGRSCILPSLRDIYVLAVDNVILRTEENKRFLCYVTQCRGYQKVVEDSANGTAMKRISRTDLGNVFLPIAGIDEQTRIADYLDKKCGEIDALIAAKERSNELLKEHRQSVIYESVTKGLDMNAKMKDSGVEWIGEIPEGWEVKKSKYCFSIIAGATPKTDNSEYWDGDIAWVTPADYKTEDVYVNIGRKNISEAGLKSCATTLIPSNSLIFSKRAPVGLVAINSQSLCTNQGCLSCVPNNGVDVKFYYYAVSSCASQYELLATGTTFKEISAEAFANFELPAPDYDIQKQIADYLDTECAKIDAVIHANESTIEKLKEYRQSIIYEAVTGKVEI